MSRYIIRRLLSAVLIVMIVVVLNFTIIKLAPGEPARIMAGFDNPSDELIEAINRKYGFDQPFYIQITRYIRTLLSGDLGNSYLYNQPVAELIAERIGPSLLLSGVSVVLALLIGAVLGLYAGKNEGKFLDKVFSTLCYFINSMPSFWIGIMLILLLASRFNFLPTQGMTNVRANYHGLQYVMDVMRHMILPTLTLVLVQLPTFFRITKSSVLQVMSEDFVMTLRAAGMNEGTIFRKYILKNAILPILTVFSINLAYIVAGSTLVEIVFSWPGVGVLMYRSILMRDYNVLMGLYLLISISVAVVTILMDLIYAALDPRIRFD